VSSRVNPNSFRLGHGSLLWGRQVTLFCMPKSGLRFNYLLLKLLSFVMKQQRFFIVDFLFNFVSSSTFLINLILYQTMKHRKRYEHKQKTLFRTFFCMNRTLGLKRKGRKRIKKKKLKFIKKISLRPRFHIRGRSFKTELPEIQHERKETLLTPKSILAVATVFKLNACNRNLLQKLYLVEYWGGVSKVRMLFSSRPSVFFLKSFF
jgi:hypothetical protein